MRVFLGWPLLSVFAPLIRCWACVFRQNVAFCHRQCPAHQPGSHHRPTHCCSGEKSWSLAEHGTTSLQSFCSDWWGHQVGVISAINTDNLVLKVICGLFYSTYFKTIVKLMGAQLIHPGVRESNVLGFLFYYVFIKTMPLWIYSCLYIESRHQTWLCSWLKHLSYCQCISM